MGYTLGETEEGMLVGHSEVGLSELGEEVAGLTVSGAVVDGFKEGANVETSVGRYVIPAMVGASVVGVSVGAWLEGDKDGSIDGRKVVGTAVTG